jgi:predicted nucleotidyltransferase
MFGELLRDLVAWLDAAQVEGVVIGGLAASILGRPRATRDVDLLVWLEPERWNEFLSIASRFGFHPRISDPLDFAGLSRVLLLRHEPSSIDLDISLGGLPFEEEAVARGTRVDIEGVKVPLVSAQDLLVMKAVAHRPRDLADIEAVLDRNPGMDLEGTQNWIREFSAALDRPDIFDDFQEIARKRRF